MLVEQFIPRSATAAILWLVAGLLLRALYRKYGSGLNKVPGTWLAGFSDWYRLFVVWGRRPELWHINLHEKYGRVVRLGPKTVSIADPEVIKVIYGLNSGYKKVRIEPMLSPACYYPFYFGKSRH